MKTKYSVIPFIPAVIAAIGLKIMSMFAVDGNGLLFGMNKSGINYFIIEIILGLFAVCVLKEFCFGCVCSNFGYCDCRFVIFGFD